jgi:probable F420-dependent oxidoreductase
VLIGVNLNADVFTYPAPLRQLAITAEDLGYESLWTGEHILLSTIMTPQSRWDPSTRMLDPLVAFAHLSAITSRIVFGTGILLLPQRQPALLAKQLASLDVLSDGRILFGVGVGRAEAEYAALQIPFETRGARADEYIDAIRELWNAPAPTFDGDFVKFADVDAHPRPVTPGGPHLMVGGRGPGPYRRAITRGNGWYGSTPTVEETSQALGGLRRAAQMYERPEALGPLEITIHTPVDSLDARQVQRFAEIGVHRLVLLPPEGANLDTTRRFLENHAPARLLG